MGIGASCQREGAGSYPNARIYPPAARRGECGSWPGTEPGAGMNFIATTYRVKLCFGKLVLEKIHQ